MFSTIKILGKLYFEHSYLDRCKLVRYGCDDPTAKHSRIRFFPLAIIIIILIVGSAAAFLLLPNNTPGNQKSSQATSFVSSTTLESTIYTSTSVSTGTLTGSNYSQAWLTYHDSLSRDGYDANEPSVLSTAPALDWKSTKLDGAIYAEPLVDGGKVIVATENNSVYALSESNSTMIWHVNLGQPVPASSLPCGDINPSGITGTPVIDGVTNTVYVVAYLKQGGHELYAINLDNGSIVFQRNVDPPGVSTSVEQQRGALALSQGMIYIPYGGLYGDCGQYHGFVIGVPENNSFATPLTYQVPTGREGGIWASSGIAIDQSGNIYVATGNSEATSTFDFGDALIRLTPSLQEASYFAPTNWAALNSGDTDLGSVGPTILNNQTIFQIGKAGVGYLLNASNLGGIGGEEFSAQVCSGAYGGIAYAPHFLFVPCTDGLVALRVNLTSRSFTKVWSGPQFDAGPPIVAGHAVWLIDVSSGVLYALNETTGSTIFTYQIGSVAHFSTPSCADGRIFVEANDGVLAVSI